MTEDHRYSVSVAVHCATSHVDSNYDWWDRALVLEIRSGEGPPFSGVARLPVRAELER